jgi:carotenoid cleavage dioxygenase-like enzyme
VFVSEPALILDPENTGELDMVLMYSIYDHNKGVNRLVVIDPKTMKTISDTDLPMRLPMTLH